ncbi:hypothetical protein [Pseudopedobacter beijingensis]|uniref:Uncharacterized protein n=1 Tax=Pseudopedobacter beijingensis TaxID=1207056 RepID=A0ABW4IET1_9SPHI
MQEERCLNLGTDLDNKEDKVSTLYIFLNKNLKQLHELLFTYHYAKRESVADLVIVKESITFDTYNRGTFVIRYTIGLSNACADLHYESTDKMKISFAIEDQDLRIKGEYWPDEEPHEI